MKKVLSLFLISMITLCLSGCISVTFEPELNIDESEYKSGDESVGSSPAVNFDSEIIVFEIEEEYRRYNAVVAVKNIGSTPINLGYTEFSVEDGDGKLVAYESGSAIYAQPSIVYPGETGYYFAARLGLPAGGSDLTLKYTTQYIRAIKDCSALDLAVDEVSFPEDDYMEVIGRVFNDTDHDVEAADVMIVCYNAQDEIVTIGGTIVGVTAQSKAEFDILNYAAFGRTDIVRYEIKAREIVY